MCCCKFKAIFTGIKRFSNLMSSPPASLTLVSKFQVYLFVVTSESRKTYISTAISSNRYSNVQYDQ